MSLVSVETFAPVIHPRRACPKLVWTAREETIVREHYPKGGVPACVPLLPGRKETAIYQKAHALGLRKPNYVRDLSYHRYGASEQIDAVIRRAYERPSRGFTKRLAKTVGRPDWWVTMRAARLGLVSPRFKEPPWSEDECEFITANATRPPGSLSQMMRRRGWTRTATAILVKLKRLGQSTVDPDLYTACSLATCMGVDRKTVLRWIGNGLLAGKQRSATPDKPGSDDRWAIKRADVRRFVIENVSAVDLRKVDKFWFVELLAGVQK